MPICYTFAMNRKRIIVLGSTGSIGSQTLEIVRKHPERFEIVGLAAGNNIKKFSDQVREFAPKAVFMTHSDAPRIFQNYVAIDELAAYPECDLVVAAMVGSVGINPILTAIEAGHNIAISNKEALVAAGPLVMERAQSNQVSVIPIDSELSALYQCLDQQNIDHLRRLVITASGGPFLNVPASKLDMLTVDDALKHPTWQMGIKNTIDSSTLVNKGMEVIGAHYLFNVPLNQIDVVVHPQSLIHSMVEWIDGVVMAQISERTMHLPIQYALGYPERLDSMMGCFDFTKYSTLNFYPPDTERFIGLALAYAAAKAGGSAPCFMNAANEVLVERFVAGDISWRAISQKLETLMGRHRCYPLQDLSSVMQIDKEARALAREI